MNARVYGAMLIRYGTLLTIGITNLLLGEQGLFYAIFTPLTIKPVYFIFHALYDAAFFEPNVIFFKGYYATLIPACIAGSAYFLLLILAMSTPMKLVTRVTSIVTLFISFLVLNIARIVIFGALLFRGYQYFDIAHLATWYFGSTLLVGGIWFIVVFSFGIKGAPFISDIRTLVQEIRGAGNNSINE